MLTPFTGQNNSQKEKGRRHEGDYGQGRVTCIKATSQSYFYVINKNNKKDCIVEALDFIFNGYFRPSHWWVPSQAVVWVCKRSYMPGAAAKRGAHIHNSDKAVQITLGGRYSMGAGRPPCSLWEPRNMASFSRLKGDDDDEIHQEAPLFSPHTYMGIKLRSTRGRGKKCL